MNPGSAPEDLQRIARALAGRYRVERELGRGGMAVVYLAEDLKHRRQVAVKVLTSDLAEAIGAGRFLREIEIAAQLNHPHILPLHDSGEADGFLFYVMPFVAGESLRQRLDREGPLPLDDALRITGEVASGLGYAHMVGIVHRDVKPENILLSGGFALVADFGIARAVSTAGRDQISATNVSIGTPGYMSPEQAMAAPHIDGRSDQYSLACVLYEMLAGTPPFTGPSAQAVLARHTLDSVPSVRTLRPLVPPAIEHALVRALAKTPADRYPTAAAFQAALTEPRTGASWRPTRRLLSYGLGVVGLLLAGVIGVLRWGLTPSDTPSVAVLPFATIGGDSAFSAGMTTDLWAMLGQVPGLTVAPRTTSLQYQRANDRERARMGIAYVVEGAAQFAGRRLKVTVTISNAKGGQIWSRSYQPPNPDVFALQDSISHDIASTLQVRLSPSTVAHLARRTTDNQEAYALYQRGRYFYEKRLMPDLEKAQSYFQKAVALDSNYALAYSGLADTYSLFGALLHGPPGQFFPQARKAALRAIELDSTLAEAHTSLGFVALFYDWDQATAERELDRAIALDPNYTQARLYRAYARWAQGEPDSSLPDLRDALKREPFSLILNVRLVSALYYSRQYQRALDQARKALELDSTFLGPPTEFVRSALMLGRCADALDAIAHAPDPPIGWWQAIAASVDARCGRRDLALARLDRLRRETRAGQYVSHCDFAYVFVALGDKDRAFAEFDSAVVTRDFLLWNVPIDPMLDALRPDSRFAALQARMGLVRAIRKS